MKNAPGSDDVRTQDTELADASGGSIIIGIIAISPKHPTQKPHEDLDPSP